MKGYNTSIAVSWLLSTVLVWSILASSSHARERPVGYEAFRNRQVRLQMEREAQLKRLEEKNSEFVKGKSKSTTVTAPPHLLSRKGTYNFIKTTIFQRKTPARRHRICLIETRYDTLANKLHFLSRTNGSVL